MARNIERDAQENERRRNQLIKAGFELFSTHDIETITLQSVADAADVGIATLYNYYGNKANLVVAISARIWSQVWESSVEEFGVDVENDSRNAYQSVELYLNKIIELYQKNPKILKFSSNYKTFICRENVDKGIYDEHLDTLKPLRRMFHVKYEQAKVDKSIRTDISEEELFTTSLITMLGMAERFAQGLVWAKEENQQYVKELNNIRDMILSWLKPVE